MLDTAYHITPSPNRVQGRHVVAVAEEAALQAGELIQVPLEHARDIVVELELAGPHVHGEDRASDPGREVLSSRPMNPGVGHRTRMSRTPRSVRIEAHEAHGACGEGEVGRSEKTSAKTSSPVPRQSWLPSRHT